MEFLMLASSISSAILSVTALLGAIFVWRKKAQGGIRQFICEIAGTDNDVVDHMKNAIVCMMREDIRQLCEKCLKDGRITSEELESLICMYESYKSLGGNTFVHSYVAKVKMLPIDLGE